MKLKKIQLIICILLVMSTSLFISAQGQNDLPANNNLEQEEDSLITLTDKLGNTVRFDSVPEKIILAGKAVLITGDALYLFPEASESIAALGLTNQGMGDFYPYLDSKLSEKRRLPYDAGVEEIAALSPELVILKDFMYNSLGKQIKRIGIPVLTLNLESHTSYIEDVKLLGELFDNEERAETITHFFNDKVSNIRNTVQDIAQKDKPELLLLYISSKDGETSFKVAPDDWIQTKMAEYAGGNPVWKGTNLSSTWKTVNFEQIASWDPDSIYIISYRSPAAEFVEGLQDSSIWNSLRAYKNGNVKAFPQDFHSWAQPDSRWILGLEWLAHELYPSEFPDYKIHDSAQEFYETLYSIPSDTINSVIIPKIEGAVTEN
ncbi:MAG: ABC transporter substrate-binding protein [Spirochaetia bacterium]|nr:ABC transporter substrate-binding protein [Spirochaetia bacterium]